MKGKKGILWLLLLGFFALGAVSCYQIFSILWEYHAGEQSYEALESYITLPEVAPTQDLGGDSETSLPQSTHGPEAEEEGEVAQIQWPQVDFEHLQAINPDLVGWIYIAGTEISYPVVQGADNEYYLKRMFDGGSNSAGAIFMDCRNADLTDKNTILYGHHMKNGSMFAGLVEYKAEGYYEAHPQGLFLTPEGNYVVNFFAGYVASEEMDAWQVSFDGEEDYTQWLAEAQSHSLFQSQVEVTPEDRVLTLSTCSYEFENARFVLVGVLQGEE